MDKINLMDVDFIIPIRIDSIDRIENLLASIDYLMKYFHTNIYVLETSHFNNHILEKILPDGVAYYFSKDLDPIFHRTKYINVLERKGIGKYIAIWDADIIINYCQILDAVMSLRSSSVDVSFPYDGRFYDTTAIIRNVYIESSDFSILSNNINKMLLPYGTDMGGGAIFINRDKFNAAGGEDETFYGWGAEDWNRIEKWKKFGYKIKKTDGPLFHLSHPRDINGRLNSEWQTRYVYNALHQTKLGCIEEIKSRITHPQTSSKLNGKKLHIGCNDCILPFWVNTDTKLYSDDVLYLDINKPLPFIKDSFEYVFAEHICENITYDTFLSLLREIFRIIKPHGIFRVVMPSLDFLMSLYHEPNESTNAQYVNWSIGTFASTKIDYNQFNLQDLAVFTLNNLMYNYGYKFMFNAKTIENIFYMTGFKNVKKHTVGESPYKVLQDLEQHRKQIPIWAQKMDTIVFEAEK